jgi:hypothetical protein
MVGLIMMGVASQIQACAAEAPPTSSDAPLSEVRFVAAFAPIEAVTLYDRDGYVLEELEGVDGDLTALLEEGVYFADIRDDYNNSVFDAHERMLFAPRIEGAELHLEPYAVPGSEVPLVGIVVGDRTRFDEHTHDVAASMEALHTTGPDHRGRMVWEAARAMVGPSLAGTHTWGTGTTTSIHAYASEDSGAWSSLRTAYGTNTSCRNDNDTSNNFTPCSLTYGSDVVGIYTCQGYCPAGTYRGGQCKAFMNLVAYRSGVYHGASWAFRTFAVDSTIDDGGTNYPLATSSNVTVGDLLRRPTSAGNPHAAIVVRVISASQIVVVDSNWVNGSGAETVASHTMGFTGTGTVSDLGTYHRLSCVYTDAC